MRSTLVRRPLLLLFCVLVAATSASAASCESLASLKLPNTTITLANTVAAGVFMPPSPGGSATVASQFSNVPAFCRVAAISSFQQKDLFQAQARILPRHRMASNHIPFIFDPFMGEKWARVPMDYTLVPII